MAAKEGMIVRPETMDHLLIGLNHRVFEGKKTPKPATLTASDAMKPEHLRQLAEIIGGIKTQLKELERVYAGLDLDKTPLSKGKLLHDLKDPRIQLLVKTFQPQLNGEDHTLMFAPVGKTLNDYYWYDIAYKITLKQIISWVYPFYEIEDDLKSDTVRLSIADLTDLLTDVDDAVLDFKLSYGSTPPDVSAKLRMQTMNLFTQIGNGDDYTDVNETVEFLSMAAGGKEILDSSFKLLSEACHSTSTTAITVKCLTEHYFTLSNIESIYRNSIPQLVDLYRKLDANGIEEMRINTLNSAVPGWTESGSVNLGDFETFITLPNYVENTFQRLDHNRNGILEFSEAMDGFPIFCNEIKKSGNLKGSCVPGEDGGQTEVVYGYLLFHGKPPRGIKPGDSIFTRISIAREYLAWQHQWRNMSMDPEIRDAEPPFISRKDLLSIISSLATVDDPEADQKKSE